MNGFAQDSKRVEQSAASQPFTASEAIATETDVAPTLDPDWINRPEAVVLATFAVLLVIWQFYLELVDDEADQSLSGSALARRLGVSYSTISRRKRREDFAQWSRSLDPDRLSWHYENGRFSSQY